MTAEALGRIKPITKKDQIVTAIKNAILAGKLESGDQIIEDCANKSRMHGVA